MAYTYWIIAALLVVGWLAVYISSRRALKRSCVELRLDLQRQIDELSAKVTALASVVAPPAKTVPLAAGEPGAAQDRATIPAPEEITPETLATIAERITALLGRKVRIRSVKVVQTQNATVSTWAQQGRVIVQASHNVAQRGREP